MMCYKLFIGATLMILAMLIEGYDEYKVREIASVHVCAFLVYYSTVVYYISFFCERQSFLEAIQEEQNDEIYGLRDLLDDPIRYDLDAENIIHIQESSQELNISDRENIRNIPIDPNDEEFKVPPIPAPNEENSVSSNANRSEAYQVIPLEESKLDNCMICLDTLNNPEYKIVRLK